MRVIAIDGAAVVLGHWRCGARTRCGIVCRNAPISPQELRGEAVAGVGQHGYAFEAAQAIVKFAFAEVGLSKLWSGHAMDNPASGKVLLKLGFRPLDVVPQRSLSRGEDILHQRYTLLR